MVDVFRNGKYELLALKETKLKGNGEVSCCGVNGIIASIQEMERAREGVAILLNEVWHSVVIDFGCVGSRVWWISLNSQWLNFMWWWGMAPMEKMVKKGRGSGMTWTGLWIELEMGIDYAWWEF